MFGFDAALFQVITYGVLALGAWAVVDALMRPAEGYVAVGKLTKPAWLGITIIATLVTFYFSPISFLGLPAVIGIIVYLVDVRPALRALQQGNNNW